MCYSTHSNCEFIVINWINRHPNFWLSLHVVIQPSAVQSKVKLWSKTEVIDITLLWCSEYFPKVGRSAYNSDCEAKQADQVQCSPDTSTADRQVSPSAAALTQSSVKQEALRTSGLSLRQDTTTNAKVMRAAGQKRQKSLNKSTALFWKTEQEMTHCCVFIPCSSFYFYIFGVLF